MLLESPPPPSHKEHSYSLGGYRTSLVPHWGPLVEVPRQHEEAPLSSCLSAGWARRVGGVVGNGTHWGPPGSRWASSYLTQSPMGPGDPASHLPCLVTEGFIPLLRRKQASASWLDGGFSPSVDEHFRSTAEQGARSGGRPGEDGAGGCTCQASRAGVEQQTHDWKAGKRQGQAGRRVL